MVSHFGMGKALGPVYYEYQAEHPFLGQRMAIDSSASEATLHAIEAEARELLATGLAAATLLLTQHRAVLDRLVEALMVKETLEQGELAALFQPRGTGPVSLAKGPPASDRERSVANT
jgi:cell division protease FtsH